MLTLSQMDSSINNTLRKVNKRTISGITTPLYSENYVSGCFRKCVLYSKWFIKCQNFNLKNYEYKSGTCGVIFRIKNIRSLYGFGVLDCENTNTQSRHFSSDLHYGWHKIYCFIFSESNYKYNVIYWYTSIYFTNYRSKEIMKCLFNRELSC